MAQRTAGGAVVALCASTGPGAATKTKAAIGAGTVRNTDMGFSFRIVRMVWSAGRQNKRPRITMRAT
jgi:hypothetical protein